jgi:hypothetical protein
LGGGIAPVKAGRGYLFPYHHGAAFPAPETHLIRKNFNIGPAAGAFKDFNTQVSAFLTGQRLYTVATSFLLV